MKQAEGLKQALKVSIPIFIASLINIFAFLPLFHWLILTVFCVVFACYKASLRHAFIVWITMIAAIFCANLFKNFGVLLFVLPPLTFFCASIYLLNHSLSFNVRLNIIWFASVMMIDMLWGEEPTALRLQMANIVLGGGLGLILSYFIFPFRSYQAFGTGLIPTLQKLRDYSQDFTDSNKLNLQQSLITYPYPSWVFEPGFNPGLRAGFRFFLVHLEQVVDLYVVLANADANISPHQNVSAEPFSQVTKNNSQLIDMLLDYFSHDKSPDTELDFTSDIAAMDKVAQKLMPASIEMLDLSPDYLSLQVWLTYSKDIRKQLLQLLMSLPVKV